MPCKAIWIHCLYLVIGGVMWLQCKPNAPTPTGIKDISWILGQYDHAASHLKSHFIQISPECIEWVTFYVEDGQPVTLDRARFMQVGNHLVFTTTNFQAQSNEMHQYDVTKANSEGIELSNILIDEIEQMIISPTNQSDLTLLKKYRNSPSHETVTLLRKLKP